MTNTVYFAIYFAWGVHLFVAMLKQDNLNISSFIDDLISEALKRNNIKGTEFIPHEALRAAGYISLPFAISILPIIRIITIIRVLSRLIM